ncbi:MULTISPECIES: hypothetical protein [Kitasatospora]|uniref:hypothetical protein n=1 Tax=Kitasatospora TaxID=2063 RepID=UPI00059E97A3|nr:MULTISPECIES: hypothetical protein [Kitasatospora]
MLDTGTDSAASGADDGAQAREQVGADDGVRPADRGEQRFVVPVVDGVGPHELRQRIRQSVDGDVLVAAVGTRVVGGAFPAASGRERITAAVR